MINSEVFTREYSGQSPYVHSMQTNRLTSTRSYETSADISFGNEKPKVTIMGSILGDPDSNYYIEAEDGMKCLLANIELMFLERCHEIVPDDHKELGIVNPR